MPEVGNKSFVFPTPSWVKIYKGARVLIQPFFALSSLFARRSCVSTLARDFGCSVRQFPAKAVAEFLNVPIPSPMSSDKKNMLLYKVRHLPLRGLCVSCQEETHQVIFALLLALFSFCIKWFVVVAAEITTQSYKP